MPFITCTFCAAAYDTWRATCPRCGEARPVPVEIPAPEMSPADSGRARPALVWVGLAAAVLVAIVAVPRQREPQDEPSQPASADTAGAASDVSRLADPTRIDPETVPPAERPYMGEMATGQVAYDAGRFDEALASFRQALDHDPHSARAANNAGQTLLRLGRAPEALAYFEQAVGEAPADPEFRFNLARALGQAGRWNEAAGQYREADRLRPEQYATVFNLGLALEKSGNLQAAAVEFARGTELAPLEPALRLALARAHDRLGAAAAARKAYEEYLELQPEGTEAAAVRHRLASLKTTGAASSTPPSGSSY